jgi:hypothetical protein
MLGEWIIMQCANCKTELPAQAKFCPECATAVPGGASIRVNQEIGTVKGQVTGVVLGEGEPTAGLNSVTTQNVDSVESGGAVVGTILGGQGPLHVGGQQHYGDNVLGDKRLVHTDNSIQTGNITDSTGVAIGHGARVNVNQTSGASMDEIARLFALIYQQIDARKEDPNMDKEELTQAVQRIEGETLKGEQANPGKLKRWLKMLADMASDIGDVVIAALTSPALGIAMAVRKVAEEARKRVQ